MHWRYPKKPDDDVKNTVMWFALPFAVVLYTSLYFIIRWDNKKDHVHFVKRYIAAVVSEKYLDTNNRNVPTIHLHYGDEALPFLGGRLYYDSLQVGDSLYKPAGSAYFYLVEHKNGVRTLRRLLDDSL